MCVLLREKKKSKYIQFAFLKMPDKMSTAKSVHEFSHCSYGFYLNWIVFINWPSRIFMVLDDNLSRAVCGT